MLILVPTLGCHRDADPGRERPDLSGEVAGVTRIPDGSVQLLVKGITGTAAAPDAVGIIVDGRTELWVRRAGRLVPASAEDIRPADTVRVWHDGVELRSLPPQYHATRIVVIHAP